MNKISGQGVMKDAQGNKIYEGQWADNMKNGLGTLYTPGYIYIGQFLNDRKHGKGLKRDLLTGLETEEEWVNDLLKK